MKNIFNLASLILLLAISITDIHAQSVTPSKSIYAPGEKIIISFSGFQGAEKDWIGIAVKGLADDKYTVWQYTGGGSGGTITFDGMLYGEYEVRGYFNNGEVVKARTPFRIGNTDQNPSAKTDKPNYKPYEKISITYSGLPGNVSDWISYAVVGSADDKYYRWANTGGKQSGTLDFDGAEEGKYEVRVYFNNEGTIRARYAFTVSNSASGKKACRTELSTFYQSMNSIGLCWGRLGSDAFVPGMIMAVQTELTNVPSGITSIGCLDFDVKKVSTFSAKLSGMTREAAVSAIDALIKEIQASIMRARVTCDKGALLESLFETGIHLGASQAIASTFMCMTIPMDWQGNIRNHLSLVSSGISGFGPCIPGVSSTLPSTVPVGATNAYEPFSIIIGIHQQVLWAASLTNCCCMCP
ncbi:MAG: hypothetical protein WBP41_09495 [Saprospiraceae bacterium]